MACHDNCPEGYVLNTNQVLGAFVRSACSEDFRACSEDFRCTTCETNAMTNCISQLESLELGHRIFDLCAEYVHCVEMGIDIEGRGTTPSGQPYERTVALEPGDYELSSYDASGDTGWGDTLQLWLFSADTGQSCEVDQDCASDVCETDKTCRMYGGSFMLPSGNAKTDSFPLVYRGDYIIKVTDQSGSPDALDKVWWHLRGTVSDVTRCDTEGWAAVQAALEEGEDSDVCDDECDWCAGYGTTWDGSACAVHAHDDPEEAACDLTCDLWKDIFCGRNVNSPPSMLGVEGRWFDSTYSQFESWYEQAPEWWANVAPFVNYTHSPYARQRCANARAHEFFYSCNNYQNMRSFSKYDKFIPHACCGAGFFTNVLSIGPRIAY